MNKRHKEHTVLFIGNLLSELVDSGSLGSVPPSNSSHK
jgi:hypothetical protein